MPGSGVVAAAPDPKTKSLAPGQANPVVADTAATVTLVSGPLATKPKNVLVVALVKVLLTAPVPIGGCHYDRLVRQQCTVHIGIEEEPAQCLNAA